MIEDAMLLLAINPTSGRGSGARVGQIVANFLGERKIEYRIVTGSNAQTLIQNVRDILQRNSLDKTTDSEIERLIAIGGDGLLHFMIQVAVDFSIPLVPIPAGTGNDFVRCLGWNVDRPLEPLWESLQTQPKPIDLGSVDGELFGAIASTGFDSLVNERANSMSWPKGPSKYNVAMALELPKFKPLNYKIEIDGRLLEREAMLIAAGNGSSYGGGMKVCPDADLNDGLLDLMILNPVSKREFIRIFPSVYEGKHVEHPKVEVIRAKEINIEAAAICYADGERIGPMPARINSIKDALLTWKA